MNTRPFRHPKRPGLLDCPVPRLGLAGGAGLENVLPLRPRHHPIAACASSFLKSSDLLIGQFAV
jgi:hypothetical protein